MDRWYHKRVHEIGWYLSMVQSVVINFSSKVYSKSLLKGLHEAKPIDLYFDSG